MSNSITNMQTQSSNALHNAIMEAGSKDRPPILQNHLTYINGAGKNSSSAKGSSEKPQRGIDNDIYSTVDACSNACEMWKAIERLKQGESINVQDLETNLYWASGKIHITRDGSNVSSYFNYNRMAKVGHLLAECYGYYVPELSVYEDEEMSKEKEIANHGFNFPHRSRKFYKLPQQPSGTSSITSRANKIILQEIKRGTGIIGLFKGMSETESSKDAADHKEKMLLCNRGKMGFKLESSFLYVMAQLQEVTPDPVDNSGPIFDDEPTHKVQNNNDNHNVFAMENEHSEQLEPSNDIYLTEQGDFNITIDSSDICYDSAQDDQDENDDLDQERDLLASLIRY
ncbi:hypothetical protein Tco_0876332 [Tanacetum coccineum]|uniref:Uncharacterized protein n=1 Tax=Tanacetum coccineum TaxID=301880 RepID=A0ABQ5BUT4_9ASTR